MASEGRLGGWGPGRLGFFRPIPHRIDGFPAASRSVFGHLELLPSPELPGRIAPFGSRVLVLGSPPNLAELPPAGGAPRLDTWSLPGNNRSAEVGPPDRAPVGEPPLGCPCVAGIPRLLFGARAWRLAFGAWAWRSVPDT